MGRTGTLWAYEQTGVVPDAMTTAKALGGGLPIGALVTGERLADVLQPGDHGSTFAGGPVVAAAALAALDVLDDPALLARVRELGERLRAALAELPGVADGPRPRASWSASTSTATTRRASSGARCSRSGSSSTRPGPTTMRLPAAADRRRGRGDDASTHRPLLAEAAGSNPPRRTDTGGPPPQPREINA